jgi:tetratricopeptide (TPR) repeat protein
MSGPGEQPDTRQVVHAAGGYAYGVVGADIHVFADRGPVYLLTEYRPGRAERDLGRLIAQPSWLLDPSYEIVPFAGRHKELAELAQWRDRPDSRLAARWLHAPGGQGKTRLVMRFAADCAAAGWKTVLAQHGPGTITPPEGSQDMRLEGAAGLLLVVDYADRWPVSHLTWLLSNALLHREVPARVLLVARSAAAWPAIRAELGKVSAAADDHALRPIPDQAGSGERERIFATARDRFASVYGLAEPANVRPPGSLADPVFGLTLALHIAALVAVDARARSVRPPSEATAMSAYLLDRERAHWKRMHENRIDGLDFQTPDSVMGRVVFTATLAGATTDQKGTVLIRGLELEVPADRLMTDHAVCYPPTVPGAVLQPLYPDRLGEDFVALSLPGHAVTGDAAAPWAAGTIEHVAAYGSREPGTAVTARMIAVLAAAAAPDRWPHVAGYLEALLRADPELAVAGGGSALAALAVLDLDPAVFEAVAGCLPDHPHADLDVGGALIAERVIERQLAGAPDPLARAGLYNTLGFRLRNAGRLTEALRAQRTAVGLNEMAAQIVGLFPSQWGLSLLSLGATLSDLGQRQQAVGITKRAVAVCLEAEKTGPADNKIGFTLSMALHNLGNQLADLGQPREAVAASERAAEIRRALVGRDPQEYEPQLAHTLANLSSQLCQLSRQEQALAAVEEAVAIYQRLVPAAPGHYEADYAMALHNLGLLLNQLGRIGAALDATERAVEVRRRLAAANPARHRPSLGKSLTNLASHLADAGRRADAIAAAQESAELWAELAKANLAAYQSQLEVANFNLRNLLSGDVAPSVNSDSGEQSQTASAISRAARERGIPVVSLSPSDTVADGAARATQRAQALMDAGRYADAVAMCAENIETCRKTLAAYEVLGTSPGAVMAAALNGRIATALQLMGYAEERAGHSGQALSHTAEALRIFRLRAAGDAARSESLLSGLLSFSMVRARTRTDLPQAADATAEATAIAHELAGQAPGTRQQEFALLHSVGAQILKLLG